MVLGCLCVDFWLWSFASERELDMKQIFRVIVCVALFAGLPVRADWHEAYGAMQRGDYETAFREFSILAEQGDAWGQYNLGVLLVNGQGTPQDYSEAVKWFKLSAEQGYADAQYNLGFANQEGLGTPQNYREAAKWYKISAEQGHTSAQTNLGLFYHDGLGVPQDYVRAHMWVNISASSGDKETLETRDLVAKSMTSEQIAEAQKRATACKAKDYKGC